MLGATHRSAPRQAFLNSASMLSSATGIARLSDRHSTPERQASLGSAASIAWLSLGNARLSKTLLGSAASMALLSVRHRPARRRASLGATTVIAQLSSAHRSDRHGLARPSGMHRSALRQHRSAQQQASLSSAPRITCSVGSFAQQRASLSSAVGLTQQRASISSAVVAHRPAQDRRRSAQRHVSLGSAQA